MSGKAKDLKTKGEFDYDYAHDILFFKCKDRQYERSIELDNVVIDIDEEGFIVGLQIFDASEYFRIGKNYLRMAVNWELQARIEKISELESKIEIRLLFQAMIRNKIIVQERPIIVQNVKESLETSSMVCIPANNETLQ